MLDDRSSADLPGLVWTREADDFGWRSLLAGQTSPYAALARMADLSGPPPALWAGRSCSATNDVAHAQRPASAGVPTQLHVWADAHHGFAPQSEVARAARPARSSWLRRLLSRRG
jgi:acetyl esterase/lipase